MHRQKSGLTGVYVMLGAALVLSGCSGSGGGASSLTTGSIFPSAPKTAAAADGAPAVKAEDPQAKPVSVAWTSARAAKCGFYFDPAKLRQSFLSSQTAGGAGPEQLAKVQQSYDNSYARVSKVLATQDDYCTESQNADIKSDLNRHLAGDFTVTQKIAKAQGQSAWEWLVDGGQKADAGKMDSNAIFFPSGGAQSTVER